MVKIKLELVGLREHADRLPSELSGGMKKRAGLARAVALDPKVLFYDEPSAGLDPVTSHEIDVLIRDLNRKLGVTSVVVTHEMDSAFRIADRMVLLDRGKFIASGTPDEMDQSHRPPRPPVRPRPARRPPDRAPSRPTGTRCDLLRKETPNGLELGVGISDQTFEGGHS